MDFVAGVGFHFFACGFRLLAGPYLFIYLLTCVFFSFVCSRDRMGVYELVYI